MKVTVYGIKACDTMKKATTWLTDNNIDFEFHNYKVDGLSPNLAQKWVKTLPLDQVINKRGTTWRKLSDDVKDGLNETNAIPLMCENTSLIKRPLLDVDGSFHLGFKPEQYSKIFKK